MHLRMRKRDGEAGAVAVIVAIMAVLLFSIGALAIDIGNGYARKRASQTTADLAALAGAAQLGQPGGVIAARKAAIDYVSSKNPTQSDDGAAYPSCQVLSEINPCWDNDGNENNGEITFYSDDVDPSTGWFVQTTGVDATKIRVVTPRRQVSFGLGSVMGFNSVTVQKAATAGIFSPGGGTTPPFYLTGSDSGLTCIKDDSPGGNKDAVRAGLLAPTAGNTPTLDDVTPKSGTAGTAIPSQVDGSHLNNATNVIYTNTATATDYTFVNPGGNANQLTYTVPATVPAGTYRVSATVSGAVYQLSPAITVTLSAAPPANPPTITSIAPTSGPEQPNPPGTFTLNGTNMKGATGTTSVTFGGGGNATGVVVNAAGTQLTGTLPSLNAGTYVVAVTTSAGTSAQQNVTYTAAALPKPTGIVLTPNVGVNTGGTTVTISGSNLPTNPTPGSVTFSGAAVQSISYSSANGTLSVVTPPGTVGIAQVIVRNGTTPSDPVAFTYITDPTTCPGTSSNRGYIDEPRTTGNAQSVINNIKLGIDHGLKSWSVYKLPTGTTTPRDMTTYIANHTDCDGMPANTIYQSGSVNPLPIVNCLRLRTGSITGFEKGYFDPDGRMYQAEPGATTGIINNHANVDIDDLFDSRFIDPANVTAFKTAIQAGLKPTALQRGWIKDAIFECPRFALLPVTTTPDDPPNGTSYYPITTFKAMFITSVTADTSAEHGFGFGNGGSLRTVKGYVFDVSWLPGNVSSDSVLGTQTYVGNGPVVAELIRDKDDGTY